jgi:hypothetical protein
MKPDAQDWLEQAHRQAVEQYWAQEECELALVKQVHEEACERRRQEEDRVRRLTEEAHRQAIDQHSEQPAASSEPPSVHYTELQDLPADSPIRQEWETYRRELPRLLNEGLEGKFALVKGVEVIGIFATFGEGLQAGRHKYGTQPFLIQPIREREPLLRTRGQTLPCHSSITRLPRRR